MIQVNLFTKQRNRLTDEKQTWLPREDGGVGSIRRLELTDIHTLLCIKWITNEELLYRELYSILCDGLYTDMYKIGN